MSTTFSYNFDRSLGGKFLNFSSGSGTEFTVIHELTWTSFGKTSLDLSIRRFSEAPEKSLAVVEISSGEFSERKSSAMEDCNNFMFTNIDFTKADSWTCLISMVPRFELLDIKDWTADLEPASPSEAGKVENLTSFNQLSSDWRRILQSGEFSNVVISDGTIQIKAHKVVLAARSTVFARMFQHGMRESSENQVTISDVAGNVLTELVGYMYTGTVSLNSMDIAKNLYVASDKYAVHDLKALCRAVLKKVTSEDALEIIVLADLHGDEELKLSALDSTSRHFQEVKRSDLWEKFAGEHKDLAIEVLSYVLEKRM